MVDFYDSPAYPYPVPDPFWDYCQTWHELQQIKVTLEKLLVDMTNQEFVNEDFDRYLVRVTERTRQRLAELPDAVNAYINADELEHIQ